jgi:hypothetical protein
MLIRYEASRRRHCTLRDLLIDFIRRDISAFRLCPPADENVGALSVIQALVTARFKVWLGEKGLLVP